MNKNFIIVLVFVIFLISACKSAQRLNLEKGFLEGKISVGPICPVERNPPDPQCKPTEETFKSRPIAVWSSDRKTKVVTLAPNSNGNFKAELKQGNYIVDFEKQQNFGVGGSKSLPANIFIESGKTTTLNIDIDTGIR